MKHIENTRRQLGELGALSRRTEAAEKKILESAEARLTTVRARLAELKPKAIIDPAAGAEYQELALERAKLATVIAQAREHLKEKT